jgi:hypothetical protein
MGKACSTDGRDGDAYSVLVVKPEGKRPLRKMRLRLDNNIRMDLREIGWKGVDWMYLLEVRFQ